MFLQHISFSYFFQEHFCVVSRFGLAYDRNKWNRTEKPLQTWQGQSWTLVCVVWRPGDQPALEQARDVLCVQSDKKYNKPQSNRTPKWFTCNHSKSVHFFSNNTKEMFSKLPIPSQISAAPGEKCKNLQQRLKPFARLGPVRPSTAGIQFPEPFLFWSDDLMKTNRTIILPKAQRVLPTGGDMESLMTVDTCTWFGGGKTTFEQLKPTDHFGSSN